MYSCIADLENPKETDIITKQHNELKLGLDI